MFQGDSIPRFAVVHNGEVKWTTDVCGGVSETQPLAEGSKTLRDGILRRRDRRADEMGCALAVRVGWRRYRVIFQPITLVDSIEKAIVGMACVEVTQEAPVLEARWMLA